MAKKEEAETKIEPANRVYSKAQILRSKQFTPQKRDVLRALLQDGVNYTKDEVAFILDNFLKKEAE